MAFLTEKIDPKYEVLERLLHPVDRQAFYALYGLSKTQTWLERKQHELVELWHLCNTDSERNLILDLLERYKYLAGADIDDSCGALAEIVKAQWHCDPKRTRIVAIASDTDPDGSQAVVQCLKNHLTQVDGWKVQGFYSQLHDALEKCPNGTNLILVEDFIGSGNKLTSALITVRDRLKDDGVADVKVYVLTVSAMKQARPVLDSLQVTYHCVHWLLKGISDYYEGDALAKALDTIKAISSKLSKKYNGQYMNPFGYEKSESLVYLEPVSVPNNVFPIFWWPILRDGTRRRPLFLRQR